MVRKDQALVNYPRAEERMPDGQIFGLLDIADIVGVKRNTSSRWVDQLVLPAADGPSVDSRPTWQRPTVIMWCMARGKLPPEWADEYEELMRDGANKAKMQQFIDEYT